MPASKKIVVLGMINLFALAIAALVGEVGFLLFWQPNYRIRCERWWVGSGMTQAGRKYWPDSTYRIESREFNSLFQTNRKATGRAPNRRGRRIPIVLLLWATHSPRACRSSTTRRSVP